MCVLHYALISTVVFLRIRAKWGSFRELCYAYFLSSMTDRFKRRVDQSIRNNSYYQIVSNNILLVTMNE